MTPLAPDTVLDPEALYVVRICYTQDDFQGGTVARSHWTRPHRAGGCGDMNHKRDTAREVALFLAQWDCDLRTVDKIELYAMPAEPALIVPIRDDDGKLLIHQD
jgi:hypothetical protein